MLMRSLMQAGKPDNVTITFVTREGQEISGDETVNPAMAMPIGPCLAGMSEYPGLRCRIFDIPAAVAEHRRTGASRGRRLGWSGT